MLKRRRVEVKSGEGKVRSGEVKGSAGQAKARKAEVGKAEVGKAEAGEAAERWDVRDPWFQHLRERCEHLRKSREHLGERRQQPSLCGGGPKEAKWQAQSESEVVADQLDG